LAINLTTTRTDVPSSQHRSLLALPDPPVYATFAETNACWCANDETTREKLVALKHAGLDGILISAKPFIMEQIPFERTERTVRSAWRS
jgi:hypothetical protein